MLTKFISVSETRLQNTETALENQQTSIQGLETEIGSLPSNTESNPSEKLNAITIQDEERLVAPEPKPRKETVMPNTVKFLKELLTNKRKLDEASHVELNAEISLKNLHEPCSSNNKGPIYEERRLKIEELDKWQTHKLRTHDKPKPRHDELNVEPNQLKVGDKVLLDATNPRIVTSEPNEAIPLTVLRIFPYGTVEVIHPKFGTFKVNSTRLKPYVVKIDSKDEKCKLLTTQ
ncbi:hypothetical protein GOBAR_AA09255 [Gossypium barbadense]|uniref:Integrase zinc-binding domain-containing protein n=1 Tax=Gossypium barbadense TaxID=3634 RepID=A0A2P5Y756_GOSBA|nr:hypothetical protein GOBAR_AA09255 [Gossypium barbadense]